MVFHRFDRQLFAALESAEGTAETIAVGDYIEVLEDVTYTVTPMEFERNHVRPSYAKIPMYRPSEGLTSSDQTMSMVEFTFTVEMTGHTAGATTTAPSWEVLLQSCGFEKVNTLKYDSMSAISSGPLFHRERVDGTSSESTAISTHFTTDSRFYYIGTDPDTTSITGQASSAVATVGGSGAAAGIGYALNTRKSYGNSSSCTIELNMEDRTSGVTGRRLVARGCRGNVVFAFTATDRVLMTFTMTGVLHSITNSDGRTTVNYNHALPPMFTSAGLEIMESSGSTDFTAALFETISLDVGNEVTYRADANSADGYKAAIITDRTPTISMNPDAIVGGTTSATVFDFFQKWLQGTPTRAAWEVGDGLDGNSFHFKAPAVQWTGVADGDRDGFAIYDCSGNLTGGDFGDSVPSAGGTTNLYSDKGSDNELVILHT